MHYLYDIWVNWFEGEEHGYNVCHYHEWRRNDKIEVLEQVPIVLITPSLFYYIENSLHNLPTGLLKMIKNRSYKRKGSQKEILQYTAIVSNGEEALAFHTGGYEIAIKKSRLIPRQEQQVYDACQKMHPIHFEHEAISEEANTFTLSLPAKYMYGLTRRERQLKKILMIAMDQLQSSNNREELLYWLSEWNNEKYALYYKHGETQEIWKVLYDDVITGWSKAHEVLSHQMIKGNPFLEKFWHKEQIQHNPSSK